MKHIKKRYLFVEENYRENFPEIGESILLNDKRLVSKSKNQLLFVRSENMDIRAFAFNQNGRNAIISIPDLTLVYFDSAYNLNKLRQEQEKLMFNKIVVKDFSEETEDEVTEDATTEIYRYYGYACNCVISLFTAIESFINSVIPDECIYMRKTSKCTEHFTKDQIQRSIQFDEKVKNVLPYFYDGKNFYHKQTAQNQHLENLKNLRNEIIHTKSEKTFSQQENLLRSVLKFKFNETFEAVAAFMNFYKKDYIIECDCGSDF